MLRTIEIRKESMSSDAWKQLLKDCGLYYIDVNKPDCNALYLQVHDKAIKINYDTFINTRAELIAS